MSYGLIIIYIHGKNGFAEISKHLAKSCGSENNFVGQIINYVEDIIHLICPLFDYLMFIFRRYQIFGKKYHADNLLQFPRYFAFY